MPRKNRFLASLAAIFGLAFFSRIVEGEGGGGNQTIEQKLESARNEAKAAKESLATITAERDTLKTDLQSAKDEATRIQGQFDALTATANATKAELESTKADLTKITGERDTLSSSLKNANSSITRLEALCGVKGVDPNNAVPQETVQTGAQKTVAQWDSEMKAASAQGPAAVEKIRTEFLKAHAAGQIAKG